MGMSHKMAQSKWGDDFGPSGLLQSSCYDVANNEITARGHVYFGLSHRNDLPEMLEYTKQAHPTIMEGIHEQSYDNLQYSSKVESLPLGANRWIKTIQSDRWLQLHCDNQVG